MRKKILNVMITLLALSVLAKPAYSQGYTYSNIAIAGTGRPIGGANVAVCATLATTAASVTSNFATLTLASNPVTAGFVQGMTVRTSGFTGGDTYLNLGTFTASGLQGGATITSLTTSTITFALTHANATASTTGLVIGQGNATTPCAPLVNIYTDQTLTVLSANPVKTTGLGNYGFSISPQVIIYTQLYGPGVNTSLLPVTPPCVINGANCGGGGGGGGTNPPNFPGISNANAPYNAACDGSTDDGTANTSMINALAVPGGTGFLCNNTLWTPPTSWTGPGVYENILLQGKMTVKTNPFYIQGLQNLGCGLPTLASSNQNFSYSPGCDIVPASAGTPSTVLSTNINVGGDGPNSISDIRVFGFTARGIFDNTIDMHMNNVFSIAASNTGLPYESAQQNSQFGKFFMGGGFETFCPNSPCTSGWSTHPSMLFHTSGSGYFIGTFLGTNGIADETTLYPSGGPDCGNRVYIGMLQENVPSWTAPYGAFHTYDLTGCNFLGETYINDAPSDGADAITPFIRATRTSGNLQIKTVNVIGSNPTGPWFEAPTGYTTAFGWANLLSGSPNSGTQLGLYGPNANWLLANSTNGLFGSDGGSNGAPGMVANAAIGTALEEPYPVGCTPSNSGGSMATGVYYLTVAYYNPDAKESLPSAILGPYTITGSSGSIACTYTPSPNVTISGIHGYVDTTPVFASAYRQTFSNSGSFTMVGTGGTSAIPAQMQVHSSTVAMSAQIGNVASGAGDYIGTDNCTAIGAYRCTADTTPGDVQIAGSLKVRGLAATTTVGTGTITIPVLTGLASGACASPTPSVTVTGATAATDNASGNPAEDLSSITGYAVNPGTGTLTIYPLRVTTNTVSVQVCNGTSGAVTSSAAVHILVHVLR